jgi:hypothetical protein
MRKIIVTTAVVLSALAAVSVWGKWVYEGMWGKYGGENGEFGYPCGVAIGSNDAVYVVDGWTNRVQRFTPTGSFLGVWRCPATHGISIRPNGTVYTCGGDLVQYFNPTGVLLGSWSAPSAIFVSVRTNGRVYVVHEVEFGNNYITYYNSVGSFLGSWEANYHNYGIAAAPNGRVYVTGTNKPDFIDGVYYYSSSGSLLGSWCEYGWGPGEFTEIKGLNVGSDNTIYVADSGWVNDRIQYFTADGSYLGMWGEPGIGAGEFDRVVGVAAHPDGARVYTIEAGANRVQYFRWSDPAVAPSSLGRVKAIFK